MRRTLATLVLLVLVVGLAQSGVAADQPLYGNKLTMKRYGAKERITLVLKDAALLFPAIGSADDPATGIPGGVTIEIFSVNEGRASLTIPAGAGKPGWKTKPGSLPSYKYINPAAPGGPSVVRAMLIQQGKKITLTSKEVGVPLFVAPGAVGVRITTGGIRNCALFNPSSVVQEDVGRFVAKNAAPPADCSDAALGEPAPPACSGSAPTCDGACGAGEECGSLGGDQCGCLPVGSSACGDHLAPACGGDCPGGAPCNPVYPQEPAPVGCACNATQCNNGWAFGINELGQGGCFPIGCVGTYPTCGGPCGEGGVCLPFEIPDVNFTMCMCAEPTP